MPKLRFDKILCSAVVDCPTLYLTSSIPTQCLLTFYVLRLIFLYKDIIMYLNNVLCYIFDDLLQSMSSKCENLHINKIKLHLASCELQSNHKSPK